DDAKRFLEAIKGDRHEALYRVGVSVGLRQGEAFALRWQDVDFEAGTLSVRHTLHKYKGGWDLQSPKTERSRRTINLPPTCLSVLAAHKTRSEFERVAAGEEWQEHGFVFTSSIGTPLDGPNVIKQLHAILKKTGLPIIRFHDLRHTCATLLLVQGVEARRVMELLGHSSITVTLNIYSHVIPALKKETALQMEAILNPTTDKITDKVEFSLLN
ncbi:MAG: site-specific integrase, partial [Bryobacteraceae bacterium]